MNAHIAVTDQPVTAEQYAAADFQPWPIDTQHSVGIVAGERFIIAARSFSTLTKTRDQLRESFKKADIAEGYLTMFEEAGILAAELKSLAFLLEAAQVRIMCAASYAELNGTLCDA